jgi:hypothetical protein
MKQLLCTLALLCLIPLGYAQSLHESTSPDVTIDTDVTKTVFQIKPVVAKKKKIVCFTYTQRYSKIDYRGLREFLSSHLGNSDQGIDLSRKLKRQLDNSRPFMIHFKLAGIPVRYTNNNIW